ncbi:hypothetical protein [Bdellovibrio sp. HCB-110]|uniref:hypothetical protein n=1 Tax=Bdellovibrio sp. HCB-110 TaxID=3391182 RepID=UPI0039B4D374
MFRFLPFLCVIFIGSYSSSKELKPLHVATIEIPPFLSQGMPQRGAAGYALHETFKSMGYDLILEFYPIRRAKNMTLKNPQIMAFVPCSKSDVIPGFLLSDQFFQTTTLVVEHKEAPLVWNEPTDLGKYKGSIGRGYSLKPPMKEVFDKGLLNIEEAPDDVSGLLKVASKRVQYHLVTDGMYKFLIETDPKIKSVAESLRVNPKPASHVSWGICFKENDSVSRQVMKELNSSHEKARFSEHVLDYVKKMKSVIPEKEKSGGK